MNKWVVVAIITVTHTALTLGLLLSANNMIMKRFDTGQSGTTVEKVVYETGVVLSWPIVYPVTTWGLKWTRNYIEGIGGYLLFLGNSFLWALVISWAWGRFRRIEAKA